MIEDVAYESVAVDSHWHSLLALQKGRDQSSLEYQSKLQLLSVGAVAGILGVSQAWVRDHATRKQPHLKCVKVGKLLKFRPADVEEFIQQMVPVVISPIGKGREMGRSRYQQGTVKLVGKRVKSWRGGWHSYTMDADGVEHRHNHTRTLGLKSEMTKDEARKKLREIIDRETSQGRSIRPNPDVTFEWFWKNNYLLMKKGEWSEATRSAVENVIKNHVMPVFGEVKLGDLSKLALQTHLYDIAAEYSESVAKKVRVYVKAALEEAVDQDYIGKNPARKLALGRTRKPTKTNHIPEELAKLFAGLVGEDHLILRLFVMTALRPGEQFALKWGDFKDDTLSVQRAVKRVKKGEDRIGDPKTETSIGQVYLPTSLQTELSHWKAIVRPASDNEYIFRSRNGSPKDSHNYLRRHLKPLAASLGVPNLTFQSLRRTFATLMQGKGSPKDAQTQLRHKDILTTLNVYTQPIPQSVKQSVEVLDAELLRVLDEIGRQSGVPVQ